MDEAGGIKTYVDLLHRSAYCPTNDYQQTRALACEAIMLNDLKIINAEQLLMVYRCMCTKPKFVIEYEERQSELDFD